MNNNNEYVNSESANKCLLVLANGLNMANKQGVFSLDESYELKAQLNSLTKALQVFDEGQQRLIQVEKPDFSQAKNLPSSLKAKPVRKLLPKVDEETGLFEESDGQQ